MLKERVVQMENNDIIINMDKQEYSGGHAIIIKEKEEIIKRGEIYKRKFKGIAKDIDAKHPEIKKVEVIIKDDHIFRFPKGSMSDYRNIIWLMPNRMSELPDGFKNTAIGSMIIKQQMKIDTMMGIFRHIEEEQPETMKMINQLVMHKLPKEQIEIFIELMRTLSEKERPEPKPKKG